MKPKYSIPLFVGLAIALAGTLLMLTLLAMGYVGPQSVMNDKLAYGGTILFIFLYIFLLVGLYIVFSRIKKLNNGSLTFKQALQSGLYTSLSTALFSVVLTIIFYELMYPEYNAEMTEVITSKMETSNASTEEIAKKVTEQANYYSTKIQAQFAFVGNLITGMAFSVLLGLFLKTKQRK